MALLGKRIGTRHWKHAQFLLRAEPFPRLCAGDMALSSLWLLGLALNLGAYEQRVFVSPLNLSMEKRKVEKDAISSCSQLVGKIDI